MARSFSSYRPISFWEHLHQQPRFRPAYPNEHVVRFLVRNYSPLLEQTESARVLDIGVGGGRHIKLLCEMGFDAHGVDVSRVGLRYTQEWVATSRKKAGLLQASMGALPYDEAVFDAVISYSVFYYGSQREMRAAIQEVHRVLKIHGKAFVVLRSTDDYRYGKGDLLESDTFLITTAETNEEGTIQHFLDEAAVSDYFSLFSHVELEKTETTFMQRRSVNSDWLITAEK